jgi:hypothetical protein
MSRNEDRLGAIDQTGAEAPPPTEKNSILDFVLPTEFVDLPTQGKFYPKDHPLHNCDSIEIRYMTAKDTDILTSKSLLKKGVAIDRMLQNIIVDNRVKVDELYSGDKNALLIAARINGFGPEYNTKVTCPACSNITEHSFNLQEIEKAIFDNEAGISTQGTFTVKLPVTEVSVECRLLTGADEKKMFQQTEKRKKHNLPAAGLTDQYKLFIVSINEETDRGLVEKFVDLMPARDSTFLRTIYANASPDVDLSFQFVCESCDADADINLPFSAEFFWPNR